MSDELWDICVDILNEVYEEAEPGLDFDDVNENPDDYPDDWYEQHVIDKEVEKEIVKKHCDKHDLNSRERTQINMTAILSYGPRTDKSELKSGQGER